MHKTYLLCFLFRCSFSPFIHLTKFRLFKWSNSDHNLCCLGRNLIIPILPVSFRFHSNFERIFNFIPHFSAFLWVQKIQKYYMKWKSLRSFQHKRMTFLPKYAFSFPCVSFKHILWIITNQAINYQLIKSQLSKKSFHLQLWCCKCNPSFQN